MSVSVNIDSDLFDNDQVFAAAMRLIAELGGEASVLQPALKAVDVSAPARPVAKAAPVVPEDPEAAYAAFFDELPDRSKAFLNLVEARGSVTISDALSVLDVPTARALGGITGSIGRWGPARGIALPYETLTIGGERAWRWIRAAEPAAETPAETAAPEVPAPVAVAEPAPHEPAASSPAIAVAPPAVEASTAPAPVAAPTSPDTVIALYPSTLPRNAQRFLALLSEKGEVSMSEALDALGLLRAKAMGGVIEPIQRLYRDAGQPLPFEAGATDDGERCWSVQPSH